MWNKRNNRELWGLAFVLPSLAGVMAFYVIPYLDVVRRAFCRTMTGEYAGISNFQEVLGNAAFRLAAANTARMMAVSVPVLVIFSLILAVPMQKGIRGGRWIKSGLLIPLAIPVASVVLLWQCIFAKQGFLNGFLDLFGVPGKDWMNTGYAFAVLVFSYPLRCSGRRIWRREITRTKAFICCSICSTTGIAIWMWIKWQQARYSAGWCCLCWSVCFGEDGEMSRVNRVLIVRLIIEVTERRWI